MLPGSQVAMFSVDVVMHDLHGRPVYQMQGARLRTMPVSEFTGVLARRLNKTGGGDAFRIAVAPPSGEGAPDDADWRVLPPESILEDQAVRVTSQTSSLRVRVFSIDTPVSMTLVNIDQRQELSVDHINGSLTIAELREEVARRFPDLEVGEATFSSRVGSSNGRDRRLMEDELVGDERRVYVGGDKPVVIRMRGARLKQQEVVRPTAAVSQQRQRQASGHHHRAAPSSQSRVVHEAVPAAPRLLSATTETERLPTTFAAPPPRRESSGVAPPSNPASAAASPMSAAGFANSSLASSIAPVPHSQSMYADPHSGVPRDIPVGLVSSTVVSARSSVAPARGGDRQVSRVRVSLSPDPLEPTPVAATPQSQQPPIRPESLALEYGSPEITIVDEDTALVAPDADRSEGSDDVADVIVTTETSPVSSWRDQGSGPRQPNSSVPVKSTSRGSSRVSGNAWTDATTGAVVPFASQHHHPDSHLHVAATSTSSGRAHHDGNEQLLVINGETGEERASPEEVASVEHWAATVGHHHDIQSDRQAAVSSRRVEIQRRGEERARRLGVQQTVLSGAASTGLETPDAVWRQIDRKRNAMTTDLERIAVAESSNQPTTAVTSSMPKKQQYHVTSTSVVHAATPYAVDMVSRGNVAQTRGTNAEQQRAQPSGVATPTRTYVIGGVRPRGYQTPTNSREVSPKRSAPHDEDEKHSKDIDSVAASRSIIAAARESTARSMMEGSSPHRRSPKTHASSHSTTVDASATAPVVVQQQLASPEREYRRTKKAIDMEHHQLQQQGQRHVAAPEEEDPFLAPAQTVQSFRTVTTGYQHAVNYSSNPASREASVQRHRMLPNGGPVTAAPQQHVDVSQTTANVSLDNRSTGEVTIVPTTRVSLGTPQPRSGGSSGVRRHVTPSTQGQGFTRRQPAENHATIAAQNSGPLVVNLL